MEGLEITKGVEHVLHFSRRKDIQKPLKVPFKKHTSLPKMIPPQSKEMGQSIPASGSRKQVDIATSNWEKQA